MNSEVSNPARLCCCSTSLLSVGLILLSDSAITSSRHFRPPNDHDVREIHQKIFQNHCLQHELKGSNLPFGYMA